jgi:hypothetical protein
VRSESRKCKKEHEKNLKTGRNYKERKGELKKWYDEEKTE